MNERIKRAMVEGVLTGVRDRIAGQLGGDPEHDRHTIRAEVTRIWVLGHNMLDMLDQLEEEGEIQDI